MSHIAKIELQVKDLKALEQACKDCGFEFVRDQHTYKWFGRVIGDSAMPAGVDVSKLGTCDHAIRVPGAKYEIGVLKVGDRYELLCDEWRPGGLHGKSKKLLQPYAIAATKNLVKKNRYRVYRENKLDNGAIELRVRM